MDRQYPLESTPNAKRIRKELPTPTVVDRGSDSSNWEQKWTRTLQSERKWKGRWFICIGPHSKCKWRGKLVDTLPAPRTTQAIGLMRRLYRKGSSWSISWRCSRWTVEFEWCGYLQEGILDDTFRRMDQMISVA